MARRREPDRDQGKGEAHPETSPDQEYVRRQMRRIEECLTKVLFGDYTVVVRMEEGDPQWGNLAMHINVAINAARNAIARAEKSEELAAMAKELAVSRARVEEQNRTLETRVAERTRELREANKKLLTLDKAKDGFLSSISHEMRTPLTSIRSFAEILLAYGSEESIETRTEFLTIIKNEAERLSRLINQILDFAKIEAGKMDWENETFDFVGLVGELVSILSGLVKVKQVRFDVNVPDEAVMYRGDRDRLVQVLMNLVSNAWKFSPENGEIGITLKKMQSGIQVCISDQGVGVSSEEEKLVIFEKFRQIGNTLTDKPQGTGLGLPISREIVLRHGGEIWCEDNPGGGALFKFHLPNLDPSNPRPIDSAVGSAVSAGS